MIKMTFKILVSLLLLPVAFASAKNYSDPKSDSKVSITDEYVEIDIYRFYFDTQKIVDGYGVYNHGFIGGGASICKLTTTIAKRVSETKIILAKPVYSVPSPWAGIECGLRKKTEHLNVPFMYDHYELNLSKDSSTVDIQVRLVRSAAFQPILSVDEILSPGVFEREDMKEWSLDLPRAVKSFKPVQFVAD